MNAHPETGLEAMAPVQVKPPLRLRSGNGYAILMACMDAAEKSEWTLRDWRAFSRKFRSGTWEEAFQLVTERFNVTCASSFSKDPTNWRNDHGSTPDDD